MNTGASSTGVPSRGALAAAVAEAVRSVPGVARLSPGHGVEVGTQFAGGTAIGVALRPDAVVVRIVAGYLPLVDVVEPARAAAHAALRQLGDQREVEVAVDDIDLDADPLGPPPAGPPPAGPP
ncbi:MAG: hypothetical protein ACRDY2_10510 [Acidimicrobiales bacterium]